MHRFIFLRHGRSKADDEHKFEGRYDSPLTDVGVRQAETTRDIFRERHPHIDRIIASPLIRAARTAEIINAHYGVSLTIDPLWMEMDNGDLAGQPICEATCQAFPRPGRGFHVYDQRANGTGESRAQLHARAMLAVEQLVNQPEGTYLVVAHGGILNAALQVMMGVPPACDWEGSFSYRFGDNGWGELTYDRDRHHWSLCAMQPGY